MSLRRTANCDPAMVGGLTQVFSAYNKVYEVVNGIYVKSRMGRRLCEGSQTGHCKGAQCQQDWNAAVSAAVDVIDRAQPPHLSVESGRTSESCVER